MNLLRQYVGLALIVIGAALLVVCYVAQWQSNEELICGFLIIVTGFFLRIFLQKQGEKY